MDDKLIPVIDNYFYYIDENNNHTLVKKTMRQKLDIKTRKPSGEPVECVEIVGYFVNLTALIRGVVKDMGLDKVKNGEFENILQHVKFMTKKENEIIKLFNDF